MILYGYGLSSAAYRVRIALALKQIQYTSITKNLLQGEQRLSEYLQINAQGLVPSLALDDGTVLTQSVAILEYLEETYPPPLLPAEAVPRARVRALMQAICSDIHPLNNLRVLRYLEGTLSVDKDARNAWYHHWVHQGFEALEQWLTRDSATGRFCHGETPTLADVCLVPQMFNARRFAVDLDPYPTLRAIDAACQELAAFKSAAPEHKSA